MRRPTWRIRLALAALLAFPLAVAAEEPAKTSSYMPVASVSDTPGGVRLRIQASGDVEPGSVEVRFAGREAVVLARDLEGRAIRSQPIRLPAAVVEEGASADYDTDGALLITLRKQATAQDAEPTGDPQAAAR
jgi:HSP20 family molecular chaperone IbpA